MEKIKKEVSKKTLLLVIIMLISVPALFVFFAYYLGIISQVKTQVLSQKFEVSAVVRAHPGDFNKIGKSLFYVKDLLKTKNIDCKPLLLFYNDDKKTVKPERKSFGGCKVKSSNNKIISKIIAQNDKIELKKFLFKHSLLVKVSAIGPVAFQKAMAKLRVYCRDNKIKMKFPILQLYNKDSEFYFYMQL